MRETLIDPNTLPAIDLAQSTKLIGSREAATEMLELLKEKLPLDFEGISTAYAANNQADIAHLAHRLVGGTAYCGVPALRSAARALEYAAEDKLQSHIDTCYKTLQQEVARFYAAFDTL